MSPSRATIKGERLETSVLCLGDACASGFLVQGQATDAGGPVRCRGLASAFVVAETVMSLWVAGSRAR